MQAIHAPRANKPCCPPAGATHSFGDAAALVPLLKALGDETRLEMLSLLVHSGEPLCVCHIEQHFSLSQPTISHHLRVLRVAGVVASERRGTWMYYSVLPDVRARLKGLVRALPKRAACNKVRAVCP